MKLTNRKFIIIGVGLSGKSVANFLSSRGRSVYLWDKNSKAAEDVCAQINNPNVSVINCEKYQFSNNDIYIVSPGIQVSASIHNKEEIFCKATQFNCLVISALDLFKHFVKDNSSIIGITGSFGKSTITLLTYEIIKSISTDISYGGNIGIPYFDMKPFDSKNKVIEISSYELENSLDPSIDIAVLSNIFPHHLDRHKTLEEYVRCKLRLISQSSFVILSKDDRNTNDILIPKIRSKFGDDFMSKNVRFFSTNEILQNGTSIVDNICYIDGIVMNITIPQLISQSYNVSNIACSIETVRTKFYIDGNRITKALDSFVPLEHRNEFVTCFNRVSFINDSKSTDIVCTINAVNSYSNKVILILGGKISDNNVEDIDDILFNKNGYLKELSDKVVKIFLIGDLLCYYEDKAKNNKAFDSNDIFVCSKNFEDAVRKAYEYATTVYTKKIDENINILLSPAFQSFDEFKNFSHRGEVFKEIVKKIEEEHCKK